ncbi:MAG: ABC transporter ATP-binding protein [Clostridia bacterium]|nr:ABC transporter ATP-binding protein [Clostridia bacterium]
MDASGPLVEAVNLRKYFSCGRNRVLKAADDVSFSIHKGSTLGLVGESGCGKTTTGRVAVRLYEATGGRVMFDGKDIHSLRGQDLKEFRKRAQMIFQNPYASLNPRMTVGDIIGEGMDIHRMGGRRERLDKVNELLSLVGLSRDHAGRFPHEFSGGQRQRIGIARALAVEPEFLVCDEPISALDVSIQSQIVNLLMDLQREFNLTYLFISHDLRMVKYVSHQVAVMYLGSIVEIADSDQLYVNALRPYTQALLSAAPTPDPRTERSRQRLLLEGDVPSPINPPDCCRFEKRCSRAKPVCREVRPVLREIEGGHSVACHLV